MTISTTSNKTVVQGNGLTNSFTYKFLVPNASEMFVYYTDAAGVSTLLNSSQYSVSGLGNPNGGTVTYPLTGSPIASGTSLTIIRILGYQQLTDLINQGGYYPEVVEAALDYLTMLTQQLSEAQNRALTLAVEADGSISVVLPVPQANYLIAWNSGANGLTNVSPASLAGIVTYGTWTAQTFNGDGTTTDFVLSSDPLTAANIDVSVGAAVQRVAIDYTYIGANTVRFSTPPPVGTNNVFMRWGSSLPLGVATSVAGQTTFGTSIIQAANAGAAIALLGAVDTSTAQTINGQKIFGLRPIMPTAAPGTSDTGGANTQFVLGTYAPVRQTVLQGATNSGGYANMLSVGTGLAINLSAATTPMITSFAQGIGNAAATLSANVTGVVSGLPANNLSYITQGYVSPTSVTWGSTLAPPQYGYAYNQTAQSVLQFGGAAGSTTFLDDFGNAWTAQGGAKVQTNQVKFGTGALGGGGASNALNGTTDYVRSTVFTSLGSAGWSLRAWTYATVVPGTGVVADISSGTNASNFGAVLAIINPSGSPKFGYNLSASGTGFDIASGAIGTTTVAANTWYFVELTYDAVAGIYRLYVNGVQEQSTTSAQRICAITNISVGARGGSPSAFFTGYIDKFEFLPYCQRPGGTSYAGALPAAAPNVAAAGYASDFFSIPNMTMYQVFGPSASSGANPSFTAKMGAYVGEAITGASAVSSVANYALQGKYISPLFGVAASSLYANNHNLGCQPGKVKTVIVLGVSWNGFSQGAEIFDNLQYYSETATQSRAITTDATRMVVRSRTGGGILVDGTSTTALSFSDCKLKNYVERGW